MCTASGVRTYGYSARFEIHGSPEPAYQLKRQSNDTKPIYQCPRTYRGFRLATNYSTAAAFSFLNINILIIAYGIAYSLLRTPKRYKSFPSCYFGDVCPDLLLFPTDGANPLYRCHLRRPQPCWTVLCLLHPR